MPLNDIQKSTLRAMKNVADQTGLIGDSRAIHSALELNREIELLQKELKLIKKDRTAWLHLFSDLLGLIPEKSEKVNAIANKALLLSRSIREREGMEL